MDASFQIPLPMLPLQININLKKAPILLPGTKIENDKRKFSAFNWPNQKIFIKLTPISFLPVWTCSIYCTVIFRIKIPLILLIFIHLISSKVVISSVLYSLKSAFDKHKKHHNCKSCGVYLS